MPAQPSPSRLPGYRIPNKAVYYLISVLMMMRWSTLAAAAAAAAQVPLALSLTPDTDFDGNKTCVVRPGPNGTDSAPAIARAFADCGHNDDSPSDPGRGRVVFLNETYHIQTVLNTTGLRNVDVDLRGTLAWDSRDLGYWLARSLPVGYQNQSSAWLFGGHSVRWTGHGHGTLDGGGQAWYDFVNGTNNYPGRPHQLTITGTSDSVFEGLRFVQSQMW